MREEFQSGGDRNPMSEVEMSMIFYVLKILAHEEGLLQDEMDNSVGEVWRKLKAR